jgi:hypothetical protein
MVETYKPTSLHSDGAIRLVLTGPRSYLLTDHSDRRTNGTRIEVLLREPIEQGKLTDIISKWCRRVEFPIIVNDLGLQTNVEAERSEQFTYEMPDVTEENASFFLRSFPVNRPGIEGELYVLARITNAGESWAHRSWAENQYPRKHPSAVAPQIPESIVCLHGITTDNNLYWHNSMIVRLDYRRKGEPTLSRETMRMHGHRTDFQFDPEIQSRWEELLQEHLAATQLARKGKGWKYKQELVREFDIPSFWQSFDGMIPICAQDSKQYVSLAKVLNMPILGTTTSLHKISRFSRYGDKDDKAKPEWDSHNHYIESSDLYFFANKMRKLIFKGRVATNIRWLHSTHLAIDWTICDKPEVFWEESIYSILLSKYKDANVIGFPIHSVIEYASILNSNNVFVKWLIHVKNACNETTNGITIEQFNILLSLLENVYDGYISDEQFNKLTNYIEAWRKLPGLEQKLYPPKIKLTREMFDLKRFIPRDFIISSEASPEIRKRTQSNKRKT